MTQNEHVYMIGSWPEVDDNTIFGGSVRTTEGYVVVNCEIATCNSFWDIPKKSFRDGKGGGHRW